jgi:hypothetical protein
VYQQTEKQVTGGEATPAKADANVSAWLLEFNYILVALLCSSAFAAEIQVQTTCGAPTCAAL